MSYKRKRPWKPTEKDRELLTQITRNPSLYLVNAATGEVFVEKVDEDMSIGNIPRRIIPFKKHAYTSIERVVINHGGIKNCHDNGTPDNRPEYIMDLGEIVKKARSKQKPSS